MNIVIGIPGFLTDSQSAEGKLVRKTVRKCADKVGSYKFLAPGAVAFTIDSAFQPHSSDRENAAALETLMTCLIELNVVWLMFHPHTPPLYHTPVYYKRTLLWDTIPCLYARGWGDCKSLAAARVAENYRDRLWCRSVFRFLPGTNNTMFHILVMYSGIGAYYGIGASESGLWEDPSKALGMESIQENPDHTSHHIAHGFGVSSGD
jgi:hypothetical protein